MLDITSSLEQDRTNEVFVWHDEDYPIDLTFDNVLRWFNLIDDSSIDQAGKVLLSFAMFVGDGLEVPFDQQQVEVGRISNMLFQDPYNPGSGGSRSFDYQQDSEAIYASFMKDYGIDLMKVKGHMSYFEFRALFNNLSDNAPINQIIQIRKENPSAHADNPEYVRSLMTQKAVYELHMTAEQRERETEAQIAQAFESL